jgi:hypothetical protein
MTVCVTVLLTYASSHLRGTTHALSQPYGTTRALSIYGWRQPRFPYLLTAYLDYVPHLPLMIYFDQIYDILQVAC